MAVEQLITQHIDTWTSALKTRSTAGRGSNGKIDLYGIKKLRELILELAVRGKLVPQDPNDEPASELLKRIAAEKAELVKQGKIKKQKPLPEISEDEKPFELPKGWKWVRLGDIGETNIGLTYSPNNVSNEGTPVLRSSNIQGGRIDLNDLVRVNNIDIKQSSLVKVGDLLICARNGSKALVGKTAMINSLHEPMAFGAFMAIFRCSCNPYIKEFMNSPIFRSSLEGVDTTTINQITQANLKNTLCPLPPLYEQEKIISKITELMSICDQLEQQSLTSLDAHSQLVETLLATLTDSQNAEELAEKWARISQYFDTLFTTESSIDALKQTILQLAVMGKLVPQDPNDEPASELLKRIEQEKAQLVKEGKIKKQKMVPSVNDEDKYIYKPEWWENVYAEDVADFIDPQPSHRTPAEYEGGVPYIGYTDIDHKKGIDFSGARKVSPDILLEHKARYTLEEGDFVFGKIGTLGNPFFLKPPFNYCLSANLILIQPNKSYIYPEFLALYMDSPIFLNILSEQKTNSTHAVFGIKKARQLAVPLPSIKEQKSIINKVFNLFMLCDTLKSRLQSAQQTQLHLADALTDAALN